MSAVDEALTIRRWYAFRWTELLDERIDALIAAIRAEATPPASETLDAMTSTMDWALGEGWDTPPASESLDDVTDEKPIPAIAVRHPEAWSAGYLQGLADGRSERPFTPPASETLDELREEARVLTQAYAPTRPSDTLTIMAFDVLARLAAIRAEAERE